MNSTSMPVNKNTQLNRVMICLTLMIAIVLTNCTHTTPNTVRDLSSEREERELAAALTEHNNCTTAQARFPTLLGKDLVECTDDYLLFESNTLNKNKPKNIKLGSFNIIRIGQAQTRFKRNDFVAQIINQWDLVTVVEIMNMGSDSIAHNDAIDTLAASLDASAKDKAEGSYEIPRYLPILAELRKMDPSWSLIMAPRGTGETTSSYEYAGFFYRNGMIKNAKTAFCGDKRGCLTPISQEDYSNLVSRSPFVARFKSGNLDFNAAGLHLRFRVPAEDCSGFVPKPGKKPCVTYSDKEKTMVANYLSFSGRPKINKEDARYLELAIAHKVLENSPEDVLLMGDFNLEFKEKNKHLWKFALGHEQVLVNEKTSISGLNGLANEYDHFVFNPDKTNLQKCSTASAKSFNFLLDINNPTTDIPVLEGLSRFMLKRKSSPAQLLNEYKEQIAKQTMIDSCTKKSCTMTKRYDDLTAKKLACLYEKNVLDKTDLKCDDESAEGDTSEDEMSSTAKKQPYKVYHELISDHIPVEMECSTQ